MKIVLILCVMLVFEIITNILFKIIRYNKSELKIIMYLLLSCYSIIFGALATRNGTDDILVCIFCLGMFQGIFTIFEFVVKLAKNKHKNSIIETFEKNFCVILSLDWIEDYTQSELEALVKMNNVLSGKKQKVFLLILRDTKSNKIKLMFFIRKNINTRCIEEFCNENCDIEINRETNVKQTIIGQLRT